MLAWRIAKERHALDRTGAGGLAVAGRWHQIGQPVIYADLSVAIASFEKLVHTGSTLPKDLMLVEVELPDDPKLYEQPAAGSLPSGWDAVPSNDASSNFGAEFLRARRALGLIVPSAVLPEERNLVINPLHPRFTDVTMKVVRKFDFDERLA